MEDERDREEFKHVCKLCSKRYPSGKSLGGHMRSHVIADARKNKQLLSLSCKKVPNFADHHHHHDNNNTTSNVNINNHNNNDVVVDDDNEDVDDLINQGNGNGNGNHSGYGLRENPKKTWRMVDSSLINSGKQHQQFNNHQLMNNSNNNNLNNIMSNNNNNNNNNNQQQERFCKQCGKGFHSLKALCGHMSIHSDKDRNFKEEDDISWSSDSKDQLFLAMESYSDNNSKRQTRSSLSRYRSLTTVDSSAFAAAAAAANASANGNGNGSGGSSSNHSEIDQMEQEEVAKCLMMLSRDSYSSHRSKAYFNFATESSDNNSMILEGGSTCNYKGIKKGSIDLINIKQQKVGFVTNGKEKVNNNDNNIIVKNNNNVDHEMDNSDSGYFENGAKELESDDSVDGVVRNYGFMKNKSDQFGSTYDNYVDNFRKRRVFDSPESDENCSKKFKHDYYYNSVSVDHNSKLSSSKYVCWICYKTFKTHQALGGHIISHRKNGENNLDGSNSARVQAGGNAKSLGKVVLSNGAKKGTASKKAKGHKCPYCPKMFKSGQALGGHKRSHMLGGNNNVVLHSEVRANNVTAAAAAAPAPQPLPPPEPEQRHPLLDLNLPAPVEEEASGISHFVAW